MQRHYFLLLLKSDMNCHACLFLPSLLWPNLLNTFSHSNVIHALNRWKISLLITSQRTKYLDILFMIGWWYNIYIIYKCTQLENRDMGNPLVINIYHFFPSLAIPPSIKKCQENFIQILIKVLPDPSAINTARRSC